jgi:hypothetical protein
MAKSRIPTYLNEKGKKKTKRFNKLVDGYADELKRIYSDKNLNLSKGGDKMIMVLINHQMKLFHATLIEFVAMEASDNE